MKNLKVKNTNQTIKNKKEMENMKNLKVKNTNQTIKNTEEMENMKNLKRSINLFIVENINLFNLNNEIVKQFKDEIFNKDGKYTEKGQEIIKYIDSKIKEVEQKIRDAEVKVIEELKSENLRKPENLKRSINLFIVENVELFNLNNAAIEQFKDEIFNKDGKYTEKGQEIIKYIDSKIKEVEQKIRDAKVEVIENKKEMENMKNLKVKNTNQTIKNTEEMENMKNLKMDNRVTGYAERVKSEGAVTQNIKVLQDIITTIKYIKGYEDDILNDHGIDPREDAATAVAAAIIADIYESDHVEHLSILRAPAYNIEDIIDEGYDILPEIGHQAKIYNTKAIIAELVRGENQSIDHIETVAVAALNKLKEDQESVAREAITKRDGRIDYNINLLYEVLEVIENIEHEGEDTIDHIIENLNIDSYDNEHLANIQNLKSPTYDIEEIISEGNNTLSSIGYAAKQINTRDAIQAITKQESPSIDTVRAAIKANIKK